ncbi:hypothetical protein V6Z11_D12G016300 [Gossypium hirsutum]
MGRSQLDWQTKENNLVSYISFQSKHEETFPFHQTPLLLMLHDPHIPFHLFSLSIKVVFAEKSRSILRMFYMSVDMARKKKNKRLPVSKF